jgi:general secretion pathway protein L
VPDIVGLTLREDRLDGAVVRRRLSGTRILDTFSLETDEKIGAALRAKLRELGVRGRRVHLGLPRRLCVVKSIELPSVTGADLRRMVGFELERHLPFPPADALFGFDVLERAPGRPVRVLLVAVERRVFERVKLVFRDLGVLPRLVDVSIHALALLAGARGRAAGGRVVVRLDETDAELAIVRDGRILGSRGFPLPADPPARGHALAGELDRSLRALSAEDRQAMTAVTVSGGPLPPLEWSGPPLGAEPTLPPGLGSVSEDALPALAMALRRPLRGAFPTNLVPDELRPRPFPWPVAVTASLAAVTLLLGAAVPAVVAIRAERALASLDREVARLGPDVRRVEQLAAVVERARREAETLRSFQGQGVPGLLVLRELTELLPGDVWLSSLSADRNGVELVGFAGSASQLIPALEASPRLERVEFTSPVTKGGDREQFRLRAGWERPAGAPLAGPEGAVRKGAPTQPAKPPGAR